MEYVGFFDGASRSNPGDAGAGCALYCDGQLIWEYACPLGTQTNNYAEWYACLTLLKKMKELKITDSVIKGDSTLVINQLNGTWKVKHEGLAPLAKEGIALARELSITGIWVRREENKEADRLSNLAIDQGLIDQNFNKLTANEQNTECKKSDLPEKNSHKHLVYLEGQLWCVDLTSKKVTKYKE